MTENAVKNTEIGLEFDFHGLDVTETGTSFSFMESVRKANRLPIANADIYYADDMWDFSPYAILNVGRHSLRISFSGIRQPFKNNLKDFVLLKLMENKEKVQTIRRRVLELKRFFNYALARGVFAVDEVTLTHIADYCAVRAKERDALGVFEIKMTLKSFFLCYSANFHDVLTSEHIRFFDDKDSRLLDALRKRNRTPDIPKAYFDRYLSVCVAMMNDAAMDTDFRAIACLHIIATQTGLRIGELLGLEADALKVVTIFTGEESAYLSYRTWKREEGNNVSSRAVTYINALSKAAFDVLLEIHHEKRARLEQPYLYMGSSQRNKKEDFPLDYDMFMRDEQKFFIRMHPLLPTLNLDPGQYPELSTSRSKIKTDFTGTLGEDVRTITRPSHHQFRVHCCTELYRKGVPLQYIQRFMGHLSYEMAGYYVRPKDTVQEDLQYATSVLRDIVTGDARLLGDNKGLSERIEQYIADNKLSVEKDLDAICSKLAEKLPIRQKFGGVCIKSSVLRDCSVDAKTNGFYCAYGMCPNIYHFYYMADISYRQAKDLWESVALNEKRGMRRQAEKEKNMLRTIVTKRLLPEIQDLKRMIREKGTQAVYMRHPELQAIVENMDEIERMIDVWTHLT